ncbi:MAG TPA: ABC-type transport auxiliary lipoprotein family protein [Usitatibacter sp.]|nr:ABC-type transport auxiliary lipoprotein family protein [Usitatibacter sp.]
MRIGRAAVIVAMTVGLPGCSFAPVNVEIQRVTLSKVPEVPAGQTLDATLLVAIPEAANAYDTTQLAYSTAPYQLAYYAHTEWADTPSNMLHVLLVRTLERTRRFRAVATPPDTGHAEFALHAQLLELRDDFTTDPAQAVVAMRVELGAGTRTLAAREFVEREPLREKNPAAGAAAANDAVARLLAEVARFVVAQSAATPR